MTKNCIQQNLKKYSEIFFYLKKLPYIYIVIEARKNSKNIDVSKNGDVIGVSWFKMPVESTSKEQINKICDILDKAKKIVINRKH